MPSLATFAPADYAVIGAAGFTALLALAACLYTVPWRCVGRRRAGGDAAGGGKGGAGATAGPARDFNVLWHGRVILSLLCAAWALSLLLRVSSLWGANSLVLPAGVRDWTGAGWMCRIFLTANLGVLHPVCACLTLLMLKAALSRRHRPEAMRHPTGRLVGLAALCALPVAAAQAAVAWLGLAVRYQGRPVEASPRSLLGYFFATYWQGTPQECGTSSGAAAAGGGGGGADGAAGGCCTMCVFPAAAAIVHALFASIFLVALCVTCGRLAAAVLNQRLRRRLRAFQAAYSALTLLGVGAAGASVAWGPFSWANQACWLAFAATSLLTVLLVEWEVVVWPVRDLRAVDKRLLQWVDAFTAASAGQEELDNRSSGASSLGAGGTLIKAHGRSADAEAFVAAAAAARTQSFTAAAQAAPPWLASSARTLPTAMHSPLRPLPASPLRLASPRRLVVPPLPLASAPPSPYPYAQGQPSPARAPPSHTALYP